MDEHTLFRQALCALLSLNGNYLVVGETGSAREALVKIKNRKPDVVITEMHILDMSWEKFASHLKQHHRNISIIMLTMRGEADSLSRVMRQGASGIALKTDPSEELFRVIRNVMQRKIYVCPSVAAHLVKDKKAFYQPDSRKVLTPRERKILYLIAEGQRSREIGEELDIAVKTVDVHRMHIMEKLDIHNVAGLVRFALREGIVKP